MILSHKHKFIYFRVPKSGSSTTQFMLRMASVWGEEDRMSGSVGGGVFPQQNWYSLTAARAHPEITVPEVYQRGQHVTPKDLIDGGALTEDQLREYDCYGFMRDPYLRFVSGIGHQMKRAFNPVSFNRICHKFLSGQGITEINRKQLSLLTIPQYAYFEYKGEKVVNPLDFRDFETSVRFLLDRVGSIKFPAIPRMNARQGWRDTFTYDDFWTEPTLQLFEGDYARDIELYKETFGEEALKRPVPTMKFIKEEQDHGLSK